MERRHQTRAAVRATEFVAEEQDNVEAQEAGRQYEGPPVVNRGRGRGRGAVPRAARGRGRGRANAANPPPAPVEQPQVQPQAHVQLDLANLVVALQQRLEAQEGVIQNLRIELQQQRVHPNPNDVPPVIPPPPPAPIPQPIANPVVALQPRADLYEKFRRAHAPEFEGSSDPLVADEWISSIQVILDFMNLTDQEKVRCASFNLKKDARYWWETVALRRNVDVMTWAEFVEEFNTKFFNMRAMSAQQRDFNNLKQGSMTVTEAVTKFNQLARLCPHLVPTEKERVRRMMEMFKPELAMAIDSGNHTLATVVDCMERALRAEYRLAQVKEDKPNSLRLERKKRLGRSKLEKMINLMVTDPIVKLGKRAGTTITNPTIKTTTTRRGESLMEISQLVTEMCSRR